MPLAPARLGVRPCAVARELATGQRLGAGDEGMEVALRALNQSLATGRQIEDQLRSTDRDSCVVDDVDVGPITRSDETTIKEAVGLGRSASLLVHDELERQLLVAEQIGRVGRIADRADVGASIADPTDGVRIRQHLSDVFEVAVEVILERIQQQRCAIASRK